MVHSTVLWYKDLERFSGLLEFSTVGSFFFLSFSFCFFFTQEPPPSRKRGLKRCSGRMKSGLENYCLFFLLFLQNGSNSEKLLKFCSKRNFLAHSPKRTRDYFLTDTRFFFIYICIYTGSSFLKSQFNRLSPFSSFFFSLFSFAL